MTAFCYTVALAWSFVPPPADGVSFPLWSHVHTARGVLAIERAMNYRLPAAPTAADQATWEAVRKAAFGAGMQTRLNPWALNRIGFEVRAASTAAAAAKGTPKGDRERERAADMAVLCRQVAAPR